MRAYFIYTDKNGEHDDYAEVVSTGDAEQQLISIVEHFNRIEKSRYGDKAVLRKFSRVVNADKSALKKHMDAAYDNLINGPGNKDEK